MSTLVYYSKMNVTPDAVVQDELKMLQHTFGAKNVLMHNGGKYDYTKPRDADAIIVTGYNDLHKGKGVGSEILDAFKRRQPVFMLPERDDDGDIVDSDLFPEDTFQVISCEIYNSNDYTLCYYEIELSPVGMVELDDILSKAVLSDDNDDPVKDDEFFL